MSQRDALIEATERLIWKLGYEAMSPKRILQESGAGQGSMYHHFSGKKALAIEAMEQHEQILWESAEHILGAKKAPLLRVLDWLNLQREALGGCRLGRLANERSVRDDEVLRAPLQRYFDNLHTRLTEVLTEAQEVGDLNAGLSPDGLASMLISVVQGGYVMSLATANPTHLHQATSAACTLLRLGG